MDGLYGTTRPAVIDPQRDAEIFYSYKANRNSASKEDEKFKKLENSIFGLSEYLDKDGKTMPLGGMYNLKLPLDKFNKKGIYTIYIRPREYNIAITDVSILMSYPDVRGVVLSLKDFDGERNLMGYRIDFIDDFANKTGESRLITSCNPCAPRKTSVDDKYAEDIRYVFTDSSSDLVFCTVTPSIANSFNPNSLPYIGDAGKKVIVSSTKFNPEIIELELVEHDAETLSYMLEGSQVRDLDKGKIITFNDRNDIYAYHDYFTLKNSLGEPLYDVKVKKDTYDDGGDDYKEIIEQ